ncbi:hypothetical protein [Brevundimonas subvibrioides]|uniref:Uncharacterized protein n=1 Tax=Brevundimonas subvibrioides (strain ATCC 15264 / DSM 4735 / LMG 14903 / NBRC 16000 / CB 81) TaxID=633149 RepID=D9QM23_BRESC|nr:hypothetical protein [Brevundimonas subvibrioides]ADL01949.1 hypothetical protein Bresu_2642 [Brevundimonas subvibrioides ATCC 15264]
MARPAETLDPDEHPLLDADIWDQPRRLTRREGTLSAGSDWIWIQPHFVEDDRDD